MPIAQAIRWQSGDDAGSSKLDPRATLVDIGNRTVERLSFVARKNNGFCELEDGGVDLSSLGVGAVHDVGQALEGEADRIGTLGRSQWRAQPLQTKRSASRRSGAVAWT